MKLVKNVKDYMENMEHYNNVLKLTYLENPRQIKRRLNIMDVYRENCILLVFEKGNKEQKILISKKTFNKYRKFYGGL